MSNSTYQISDLFSVQGKVVIITGGGSGLGKALAQGFATNGAKVYITGRRIEVLEKARDELSSSNGLGGQVIPVQGDVSTKDGCAALVKQITEKEDHIDVLINNAGVSQSWNVKPWDGNDADATEKALWDGADDEHFNTTHSINVNGVYFTTVGFIPLLRKSNDPSVIVIASIAGVTTQRGLSPTSYAISKAAALHLSKNLAGRLSPMKIRVNCVCPGLFPTEMTTSDKSSKEDSLGPLTGKAAKRSIVGRAGRPEEIIGPCLMLSSKAGGFMTGGEMMVDGGRVLAVSIHDGLRLPEDTYNDTA